MMLKTLLLVLSTGGIQPVVPVYQKFIEVPQNVSVIEGGSVILRCSVANLAGDVQWTSDGFAMGSTLDTIRAYCKKCEPVGDPARGQFHLKVTNVELNNHNNFECQVGPDPRNPGRPGLRSKAYINVLVPPKDISLEPNTVMEMLANTPRQLTCVAREARPKPNISWLLDGNEIQDPEIIETVSNSIRNGTVDTENILKWTGRPYDHGSTITCRVEHEALGGVLEERHTKLNVYYPPGDPVIIGYDEQMYEEGESINMTCLAVGGNPHPVVAWYKEPHYSTPLPMETFRQNGTTYSLLTLRASSKDHGSVYTCKAWNNHSEYSIPSRPVVLNISFSADSVEIEGPSDAELGKTVQLTCTAENSNPPSVVSWLVEGEVRRGNSKTEPSHEGGYRTISYLDLGMSFNLAKIEVTCLAVSLNREKKALKIIRIQRPPEAPKITGFPTNKTLREGDLLSLECISEHGSPLPRLIWKRDAVEIQNQTFQFIDDTYSRATLHIQVSRQDNNVEFSCEASNGVNFIPVTQRTRFEVYFPPLDAQILMTKLDSGPELAMAVAGDRVELQCTVETSNPGPGFRWLKNGVEVNGRVGASRLGKYGGKRMSQIFPINDGLPIRPEDDGSNYTCIAFNPTIEGTEIVRNFSLVVRYKPQFSGKLRTDYVVVEGEPFTVELHAVANPDDVSYRWQNQYNLNKTGRFEFNGSRMRISRVSRQDTGQYSLVAENTVGSTIFSVFLNVTYPARILNVSAPVQVKEGDTISFECTVDGNPVPPTTVRWIGPGRNDLSQRAEYYYFNNHTFQIIIRDVTKEDRGRYDCVADNELKPDSADKKRTKLKVEFKPQIRKFARYSKFSENRMHQIIIPCVAYGFPLVRIYWQKAVDGDLNAERFEFHNDGLAEQIEPGTWTSHLKINSVENSDYTKYRCVANNSLGEDSHIIQLVQNSKPDPPRNLIVTQLNTEMKTVRVQWEPGFDGGFDQSFFIRIREVNSNKVIFEEMAIIGQVGIHQRYIFQDLPLETNGEYAFAVKARNVQGDSAYCMEQVRTLWAAEVQAPDDNKLPRVVIVAIVLGSILVIIILMIVVTCCVKQHKESSRRDNSHTNRSRNNYSERERSLSESSRKSMVKVERYPVPKYMLPEPGFCSSNLFISPPSNNSLSDSDQQYKHLARSLSMPDPDAGPAGYPGRAHHHSQASSYTSCSVHGTLSRRGHADSVVDTTLEEDVFDDRARSHSGNIQQNSVGFNSATADRMFKSQRTRTGSLTSPTGTMPVVPRLGVSGLYTDYMERRQYLPSNGGDIGDGGRLSVSPPSIPSPPPPPLGDLSVGGGIRARLTGSTGLLNSHNNGASGGSSRQRMMCNGGVVGFDPMTGVNSKSCSMGGTSTLGKKSSAQELTRRMNDLGSMGKQDTSSSFLDPPDTMTHLLSLDNFPPPPPLPVSDGFPTPADNNAGSASDRLFSGGKNGAGNMGSGPAAMLIQQNNGQNSGGSSTTASSSLHNSVSLIHHHHHQPVNNRTNNPRSDGYHQSHHSSLGGLRHHRQDV